jgi:hypothetical protein
MFILKQQDLQIHFEIIGIYMFILIYVLLFVRMSNHRDHFNNFSKIFTLVSINNHLRNLTKLYFSLLHAA